MEPKCEKCGKSTSRCKCYEPTPCGECGMMTKTPREYHPYAVCAIFKSLRNSDQVRANVKFLFEYAIRANEKGVSIDDAMADFNTVL